MPLHDWTRVDSGTYHDFHQVWTVELRNRLNRDVLPEGYFAMTDQRVSGPEPDVVTLESSELEPTGGLAVAVKPPRIRQAAQAAIDAARYTRKANRIVVHKELGRIVAVIEVVSPGNKSGHHAITSFYHKAATFLRNDVHFLLVDPFPPTTRDPEGLASLIWRELMDEQLPRRPADKPLTVAAFDAGPPLTAYVEALAVGDELPDAPLFLAPEWYVDVPLEATYMTSWEVTPKPIRALVETPAASPLP